MFYQNPPAFPSFKIIKVFKISSKKIICGRGKAVRVQSRDFIGHTYHSNGRTKPKFPKFVSSKDRKGYVFRE